jgi:hypothetical protein
MSPLTLPPGDGWPPGPASRRPPTPLRGAMRGIADGDEVTVPPTIEDATVLDRPRPILRPSASGPV